jgi:hypothetical protein
VPHCVPYFAVPNGGEASIWTFLHFVPFPVILHGSLPSTHQYMYRRLFSIQTSLSRFISSKLAPFESVSVNFNNVSTISVLRHQWSRVFCQ